MNARSLPAWGFKANFSDTAHQTRHQRSCFAFISSCLHNLSNTLQGPHHATAELGHSRFLVYLTTGMRLHIDPPSLDEKKSGKPDMCKLDNLHG